jgi:hypothetical protein
VKPSKDISNELREIAPTLSKLNKKNFYEVSDAYFEESSVKIIELVDDIQAHAIDLPPVLASIEKSDLYKVPHGYFASFSDQVAAKIHAIEVAEELVSTAPMLSAMEKKEPYAVPANYFSVFPMIAAKLAAKDSELHDSPIEHEISRWSIVFERIWSLVSRPAYTFSMACMVATVVVVGVVFSHSTLTPEEKIFAQMQQMPESELQRYIGKHRDDFDERTILHNINGIEFTHYFDKPENIPAHLKNGGTEVPENISEDIID